MWKEANNVNLRSKNTWQAKALVQLFTYLQVRYGTMNSGRIGVCPMLLSTEQQEISTYQHPAFSHMYVDY